MDVHVSHGIISSGVFSPPPLPPQSSKPSYAYVLNSAKTWVIKWSIRSEKGKFTREAAGKHKVILKFIENYLKISKYRSLSDI